MALTKKFKSTILTRAQKDPLFRRAMLAEAINEFLSGDINAAKAMLRDYINATISFKPLAKRLHRDSKSLQRMLGPAGNPTSKSLFEMIKELQAVEKLHFEVRVLGNSGARVN